MSTDIERVIRNNLGLVYMQLNRFGLRDDQEAESLAYEALWKAAKNYDPTKGTKFSTLAVVCIYNTLCNYLRKIKTRQQKVTFVSYNNTLGDSDTESIDMLASEEDIEYEIERAELRIHAVEAFERILARTKNPTRRAILVLWQRQHFSCAATYIARELVVSASYVSQVLKNTKHLIRKELEARNDISCKYN